MVYHNPIITTPQMTDLAVYHLCRKRLPTQGLISLTIKANFSTAAVGRRTRHKKLVPKSAHMPGFCPASFRWKFHFYQLEANIVKVLSWTWVDQRAVGDRARCGRFGAEVLLLSSLMNTSFWQISEGSKFPTTGSKGADHEDAPNICSHRPILSAFHTCELLIYTTQLHRRTIFSSGVMQGQGCGAHVSYTGLWVHRTCAFAFQEL